MRAFSLVELSIVLVILGLLTGGILAGQSLIRAAELRSVSTDYQRYTTAIHTFHDRYMALPGDMRNATAFWGIANGTTGNDMACYNTISTDAKTCNGNGNGKIKATDNVTDESAPEWFRFWQHMANAGLIEGSYTGSKNGGTRNADPGVNVAAGRLSNSAFTFLSYDDEGLGVIWWKGRYDAFAFGADDVEGETAGAILRAEEAWNIDTKLDDGKPAIGKVRDFQGSTCHTGSTQQGAAYNLTTTTINCAMLLAIQDPGI